MLLYTPERKEKFEASSDSILNDFGIKLQVGRDFDEFKEASKQARPHHSVQSHFNTADMPLSHHDALWLIGRDHEDRVIYLEAMKVLKTRERSLAEYLTSHFAEFLPEPQTVDFSRTRYRPGPSASRMSGRIVYAGEFWIDDRGSLRGSGLANVLCRYGYLLALRELDPDYFIAFMLRGLCDKGVFFRTGFYHAEPHALRWCMKGSDDVMDGAMIHMSAEDMLFSLETSVAADPGLRAA